MLFGYGEGHPSLEKKPEEEASGEGEVMKMKKCKHVFIYDKFGKGHCIYCLKADESSRKLYFCHECNKKHSKEGKC